MKKLYLIILLLIAIGLFSCSDFLTEYSQDKAYIQGYEDLDELLLGNVYFTRYQLDWWPGEQLCAWLHVSGDEVQQIDEIKDFWDVNGASWVTYGFYTWQNFVDRDPDGEECWDEASDFRKLYSYSNAATMILEECKAFENSKDEIERENIQRIKGECYFMRASCYFLLVNAYGKPYNAATASKDPAVPLKLTNYVEDINFHRNSVAEVYSQIVEDLLHAEECLKDVQQKSIWRADIHATRLMLSRIYLYMCDYENAQKYAALVVEKGPVLEDLNGFTRTDFLNPDLSELIFSTGSTSLPNNVAMILTDNEYITGNSYEVSQELYNAFDPEHSHDLRLQYYVGQKEDGTLLYKKMQLQSYMYTPEMSDIFLLRTSEAYLNLAEAAACAGDETSAHKALNALRSKRIEQAYFNESEVNALTGENLVQFIRDERFRELCLEGHRWFDLRRYRVAAKYPEKITLTHIMTARNYDTDEILWKRKFVLLSDDPAWVLPLPREEVDKNTGMGNNPRNERTYENLDF